MHPVRVGVSAIIVRDDSILLVEFDDETGRHFNLPGGGVEPGETLHEALHREVREECDAEVEIGRLAIVWEYVPARLNHVYGSRQKLNMAFLCTLRPGSQPRLPERPDPNEVAVRWVLLSELLQVALIPEVGERILEILASPSREDPLWEMRVTRNEIHRVPPQTG